MLLTILGVLGFLLDIFWKKIFNERIQCKIRGARGSASLLGFFLLFFGMLVPISGMEEPELVNDFDGPEEKSEIAEITEKKVRLKQLREKVLATIKGEDEAVKAVRLP